MNHNKLPPPKAHRIGNWYGYPNPGFAGDVYTTQGLAPTLHAHSGGNTMPFILLEHQSPSPKEAVPRPTPNP